jgi:hypothetical protein
VMVLVYGTLFAVDPRMDDPLKSVARHMSTPHPTMFWEYLLWSISPLPFVFSAWGLRSLFDSRPALAGYLLLWCVPTLVFYFRATTTCRYFLNAAVPFAIAGAVGMNELVPRLRGWLRPSIAWATTVGLASLHLFLALGHVMPNQPLEWLYGGTFSTHDGPMPTGALLVRTYLTPGSLARSLPRPTFGRQSYPFWEGPSFTHAVNLLADPMAPNRTVVVILSGGFGHAFHYHTQVAHARFTSLPPKGDVMWGRQIWLQLGNSRVMTIGDWTDDYRNLDRFDVKAGDSVWTLAGGRFSDDAVLAKLPPGFGLAPAAGFDSHFRMFDVVRRNSS